MLALRLSSESLLAEADTLSIVVNDILLDRLLPAVVHSLPTEIILRVLCEEMLTCNLFDGCVEVCAV